MFSAYYTAKGDRIEGNSVQAAEVATAHHTVKLNLLYKSITCGNRIIKQKFGDSCTAKQIQLGRTKAEAIINGTVG